MLNSVLHITEYKNFIIISNFSINLDAIASLEARRQNIEAKYHDIYSPEDTRSESLVNLQRIASALTARLLHL